MRKRMKMRLKTSWIQMKVYQHSTYIISSTENELAESSEEEDVEEEEEGPPLTAGGDRNSQLTVGYKGDRSYVVRGNNIGVFNHSAGNEVKYYATISKLATPKGKEFKPKNVRCTYTNIADSQLNTVT